MTTAAMNGVRVESHVHHVETNAAHVLVAKNTFATNRRENKRKTINEEIAIK